MKRFEQASSAVLAVAAVAIATSVVYRTMRPVEAQVPKAEPRYTQSWKAIVTAAFPIGGLPSAPVVIVEISDFECPACRSFHPTLEAVQAARPRLVSTRLLNYPIARHRFAMPAARAAECAAREGRFAAYVRTVYAHQDSLGLLSWGELARRADIRDTAAVAACATLSHEPTSTIARSVALADSIQITGTPTIVVNGWVLPGVPSATQLLGIVDGVAQGRTPLDIARTSQ